MFKARNVVPVIAFAFVLLGAGLTPRVSFGQKVDPGVPKKQRTLALGEDEVKQLLLLMDTDKNGRVSKKEFMDFMSAEFDRLDKDKSGELDQKELEQSQIRPSRPAAGR